MKIICLTFCFTAIFSSKPIAQKMISAGLRVAPFYSSLGKFMNEEHLINDGIKPMHDSRTYIKYGIGLDFGIKRDNLFHKVQFSTGHRYIHESLERISVDPNTQDESGWIAETEYNQLCYVASYIFGGAINAGKFEFSGGMGGSLQRIGKGYQSWYTNTYYTPASYQGWYEISKQTITTSGGWGIGLVSQLEIGYRVTEKVKISATLNNYLTFLMFIEKDHYVGTIDRNEEHLYPYASWDNKIENKSFRLDASRISPGFMVTFEL